MTNKVPFLKLSISLVDGGISITGKVNRDACNELAQQGNLNAVTSDVCAAIADYVTKNITNGGSHGSQ